MENEIKAAWDRVLAARAVVDSLQIRSRSKRSPTALSDARKNLQKVHDEYRTLAKGNAK